MPQFDPFLLALVLALGGLALWGLAYRMLPRRQPVEPPTPVNPSEARPAGDLPAHGDAVIVVAPGGRLVSINPAARALFGMGPAEEALLEGLARRARPAQAFLDVCAAEGRAQFVIANHSVEANSYTVPGPAGGWQVIAMRQRDRGLKLGGEELTSEALEPFIAISQAMAASLDLTDTVQAVFENIEKLVPADWREITLWDAENEALVPYRLFGRPEDGWTLETAAQRYTTEDGFSGYLARRREPLFLPDVTAGSDLPVTPAWAQVPLRAYLGVPLLVGDEFIGTLELGSLTPNSFRQSDFDLVRLVSGQAAIAIHNARMYRREQRRVAELAGLSEVAQAFVSVRDRQALFEQLSQKIAQLVPVEVAGFLLYNENSRSLEGQVPFYGLPAEVVELYRSPVPVGSAAEAILLAQEPVVSANASDDPQWKALGLDGLAQAASLRESVLAPLTSAGRVLGFLQASNRKDGGAPFTQDELRLLTMVANQSAPVIENASLVQQARQRAQRAESLRRITSLSNSAATFSEILQFSLVELTRLLGGDRAGVFLLDEDRTTLRLESGLIFGPAPDLTYRQMQLKVEDPQFPFTITGRKQPLRSGSLLDEKTLIPFYQTLGLGWGLQSVVAVPLVVRNAGIGELWIGSPYNHAFDQGDVMAVATAAGQLAGVVEQSFLAAQTDERLRQRVNQLTVLTRMARQLSASADVKNLLQIVFDEALQTSGAQRGTIQLFDPVGLEENEFIARYFTGDPPAGGLTESEIEALAEGEPACLPDPSEKGDGSLLIVPIIYRQRPLGLIRLYAPCETFTAETIETTLALAAQAAVALGGAMQLEEQTRRCEALQRRLETEQEGARQAKMPDLLRTLQAQAEEIFRLQRQAEAMRAGLEIAEQVAHQPDHSAALDSLAREIMTRFGLQVALTAEQTPGGPNLLAVHGALPEEARPETLFGQRNPLRHALQEDRLCIVPNVDDEPDWANCSLLTALGARSFVAMPLKVTGQNRLGVLVVGKQPLPGYPAVEQVFSRLQRQVEVSMQNMSLLGETRRRLSEVNRLLDFSRRLGSLDSSNVLNALLESAMNLVPGFQAGWVAVWEEDNRLLRTQAAIGYPQSACLQGLCYSAERSPAALPLHLVTDGLPRRLAELDFARSYPLPAEDLLYYRRATGGRLPVSSLLVPIRLGWRVLGVLALDNFDTAGAFSAVDEKLTLSLAQQTALALENSRLYEESRRLTEDLEQRVQERTAELSRAHRHSQTMLKVITELSASLDLDQVLNRALAVLNESTGAEQSLILLAIGEQVYKAGAPLAATAKADSADAPQPERELARQVMRVRAPILSVDLAHDTSLAITDREGAPFASVVALPLVLGEDVLGALLLLHRQPDRFQRDQIPLLEATARQISITLNNAELFVLIRDQSERLGAMLREQQIQSSRSLAILEAIADGVVVTDRNNLITLFNASAERILDLEAHQVLRRRLDEFGGLFGPQTRAWIDTIRTWSDRPDELFRGESYAEQMTLDNGRVVAVHLAPAVWRHEFLGTVSIFRDITHEVQVDRLKSEFVANVSHELRTPLTSIKGYVELILKGAAGPVNEQQEHFLQITRENTERLTTLVNDLLDISKIESGRVDLDVEPLDLAAIVAEVASEARQKAEAANRPLRVEVELPSALPPVHGDYGRIRQVLTNLVSNAYNYTPPDGLILLQARAENGAVQVDVHDNGIGIPPEAHERIFERFYRGEDPLVLATAGTGLGLAIAKIIVEMHHGKIWFTSSGVRGDGSTFSFTLPVEQSEGKAHGKNFNR